MNGAPLVTGLARLYPADVGYSNELADVLAFVESPHDPRTVVRAGYGAGLVVAPLAAIAFFLLPVPLPVGLVLSVGLAVSAVHAVHQLPHWRARFRRTRALGDTPNLIGRAVLRMQIQPATESAVAFAADTGEGPLAESLSAHIDRSLGTPRSGLLSFAGEWAEWFPALRRSAHLLATAEDAPPAERARTLDRSMTAVLDGTRDRMSEFTASIRGPATALYAFGVMIPLALVALVPAITIAGYPVSLWFFVVTYNVVLPVMLVAASVWLLSRRPVAFPPPNVDRTHPDIPDRAWPRAFVGVAAGVVAYAVVSLVGPAYLATVAGVGFGLGVALLALFHPVLVVRNHVRDVEEHLVDALYIAGRQVAEGEAVESAVQLAGERVPAETGEMFATAAGLQRRLHVGVEEAFLGTYGALTDVPSPRAHSTAALLSIAAEEGQPAGRAIVSMADHLEELQEVERKTKRELNEVTGTLDNTAAFFSPVVGGATVGLAAIIVERGIDAADVTEAEVLPVEPLGVVVGVFLITLCLILTPLSMGLRYGLDRAMVGYYVGRALVFAVPLYVGTVAAVTLFV